MFAERRSYKNSTEDKGTHDGLVFDLNGCLVTFSSFFGAYVGLSPMPSGKMWVKPVVSGFDILMVAIKAPRAVKRPLNKKRKMSDATDAYRCH